MNTSDPLACLHSAAIVLGLSAHPGPVAEALGFWVQQWALLPSAAANSLTAPSENVGVKRLNPINP